MILPLPVSSHAEDAVKFITLDGYPEFFKDMEKGFPKVHPKGLLSRGIVTLAAAPPRLLEVHEVGDFIASFVPTLADFERLDPRFRLPPGTWEQLPQYRDWGFAVFQLKAGAAKTEADARRIHPMAFHFPTRMPESLYFPTLHIHDGKVSQQADFDHVLYFQGEPFAEFAHRTSTGNAVTFMKVGKAKGIVQPDAPCYKRGIVGVKPNEDTFATNRA